MIKWPKLVGLMMVNTIIVLVCSSKPTRAQMNYSASYAETAPMFGFGLDSKFGEAPTVVAPVSSPNSILIPSFLQPFIRMVGIGKGVGQRCANLIFKSGDLNGSCDRISCDEFSSMSVQELRAEYDILLFSADDTVTVPPPLSADWTSRLLPFLLLGGGIIWEDNLHVAQLKPEIAAFPMLRSGGVFVSAQAPGITEGITDNFLNMHQAYTKWSPRLKPFLRYQTSAIVGLYGEYPGGGRIVLTGPDSDSHGIINSDGTYGIKATNQYHLLRNEMLWVFSGRK